MFIFRFFQRKVTEALPKKSAPRIDENWPLGIRLGSTVRIDEAPFILGEQELKFLPPSGDLMVKAAGCFNLSRLNVFRFYLVDLESREFVLQICQDQGKVVEVSLFTLDGEVTPQTGEEWSAWLNEKDGFIGARAFEIYNKAVYSRLWKVDGRDWVSPELVVEKVTNNPYQGDSGLFKHQMMLYGRENEGITEHCLVETFEGVDESGVTVYVGIPLESAMVTVL